MSKETPVRKKAALTLKAAFYIETMRGELSLTEPIDKVYGQLPVRLIEKTVLEKSIIADNNIAALTNLSRHHHTEGLNGIVAGKFSVAVKVYPALLSRFRQNNGMWRGSA